MKLISQYHEILKMPQNLNLIEKAGRTCYQSQKNIQEGSSDKFTRMLIRKNHMAMIEFEDIVVRFITNRGISHELVRHRLASFAQESTRYVSYRKDIEFIYPVWWDNMFAEQQQIFIESCEMAEKHYKSLLYSGSNAQEAREVLTVALKTDIVVKANLREWIHILNLRTSKDAHPQMQSLMNMLFADLRRAFPAVFDITLC